MAHIKKSPGIKARARKRRDRRRGQDGKKAPANRAFPLLVAMTMDGGVFIRCFVDRAVALRVIEARDEDEVYFIVDQGFRIELSFHESAEAAYAALQRAELAAATVQGRA